MKIPIPQGLELPAEPQFDLPVTFTVDGESLIPIAIGGVAIPAEEEDEADEEEMEVEGTPQDFASAVERAMAARQR